MKVNKTFEAPWTTYVVEKEPEKIQAWSGIEFWPLRYPDATLYIELIKPTGEQTILSS